MKFVDAASLYETEPAALALLSTFQFDPDFFERRLLRCPSLAAARRIAVFMDAAQWYNLIRQDTPARLLNRRYLVVPVRSARGVFHPKLNLVVTEQGGVVQCGSNNLTRSGCSSNLELLNCIPFDPDDAGPLRLARDAFAFFERACQDAEEQVARIARRWLEELSADNPWLKAPATPTDAESVRLLHTYDGSLWDRVDQLLAKSPPRKLTVITPFYDADAEMVRRVCGRWPQCEVELVAQQQTTTLPVATLKPLAARITLSELRNTSRRLHAKLLCWETGDGTGCLVGSANFTTAAFDARNVEACLLVPRADELVAALFDRQLGKRTIKLTDFTPGTEQEPQEAEPITTGLRLTSAVLTEAGELRVGYRHGLTPKPDRLRLGIRTPDEQRHRALLDLPNRESGTATLTPQEAALRDAHGTILATLIAETDGRRHESPPVWIVQEGRLTHEVSGEGSSSAKSKVEESGEGLTEFLEDLGKREGVSAVVEYLRHLNIRFHDGGDGFRGRAFRLRIRDPFHPDAAPAWLLGTDAEKNDLTAAILDFTDRHEKLRLNRHAQRGNINGIENFLDIFTALVRLLYVYHVRGRVVRGMLVGRVSRYVRTATGGTDTADTYSEGYLATVADNLRDTGYLQEVCDKLNFLGQVRAALLIAQKVRYTPGEVGRDWTPTPPKGPADCLPDHRKQVAAVVAEVGLTMPTRPQIMTALRDYNVFSTEELAALEKEIRN